MYVDTSCSDTGVFPADRMQRAEGRLRLAFRRRAGATRIAEMFQEGCGKARLPRMAAGDTPQAVLINTAGGLTGGDRFDIEAAVGEGGAAIVTTQACERIYRSTGDAARVSARLRVGADARLGWLPQETILFDGGRLERKIEVEIEQGGELLAVEAVLFGRAAMGETVRRGSLHDRWRIRCSGRLVFADDLRFDGDIAGQLVRPAVLAGGKAMATVVHVAADAERHLGAVREAIGDAGGASAWGGKLVARMVAGEGLELRRGLEPVLSILMDGQALPKVWQL